MLLKKNVMHWHQSNKVKRYYDRGQFTYRKIQILTITLHIICNPNFTDTTKKWHFALQRGKKWWLFENFFLSFTIPEKKTPTSSSPTFLPHIQFQKVRLVMFSSHVWHKICVVYEKSVKKCFWVFFVLFCFGFFFFILDDIWWKKLPYLLLQKIHSQKISDHMIYLPSTHLWSGHMYLPSTHLCFHITKLTYIDKDDITYLVSTPTIVPILPFRSPIGLF